MVEFIFFLTYNDVTVPNALEVFEEVRDTSLKYVGFKDIGLPRKTLDTLHTNIKKAGMTSVLEVVTATHKDNLRSIQMGIDLGVDYLIGGTYVEESLPFLEDQDITYCPYIGQVIDHPCLLRGTIAEITEDAKRVEAMGVGGIDLLAYRYDGDVETLIQSVNTAVEIPIIVAGSINSLNRIQKMLALDVWGFTIGSAVFDKKFVQGSHRDQVHAILHAIQQ
jgi:hypothetical protein